MGKGLKACGDSGIGKMARQRVGVRSINKSSQGLISQERSRCQA